MNRHTWREVGRQFRESGGAGIVAVVLVTVATAWGGALWCLRVWVSAALLTPGRPATVVAVIRESSAGAALRDALEAAFPSARPRLAAPESVRQELSQWFPELAGVLAGLETGNFPPLLELEAGPASEPGITRWLSGRAEVSLVVSSREWERRLQQAISRALLAGFALATALLLGCCALVLLVIRLLVLEHADEIAIMRLIGAHERDIRRPYLILGCALGVLGGLLGVTILLSAAAALGTRLQGPELSPALLTALPAVGGVAGAVGAAFGLAALPEEP